MDLTELADRVIAGGRITRDEALAVLRLPDADTVPLVAEAGRVRRAFHGDAVKLDYIVNLKSGKCPEDCIYCPQRLGSDADILRYSWLSHDEAVELAARGVAAGARSVCLVSSGNGPSNRDVERVGAIARSVKERHPSVEVAACIGILKPGQAERLAEFGVDAYNHNYNTSASHYPDVCTTHTHADRVRTVRMARDAGLSIDAGLLAGMGQRDEQLVEVAFELLDAGASAVPVNFLMAFDGTPLAHHNELTAQQCLRILAMIRLVHGKADVRVAAGREQHLGWMQPLALEVGNAIYFGDYATGSGQEGSEDLRMIAEAGLSIYGSDHRETPGVPVVHIRDRGAGTALPANA